MNQEKQRHEEQQDRLERLRASVRILAQSDPQRLQSVTLSWKAHLDSKDEDSPTCRIFPCHYSFDSHTYENDVRFQIMSKLRDMKLQGHSYSQEIMRNLSKIDKEQVSHFSFGDDGTI
jgi:hypothetical protein